MTIAAAKAHGLLKRALVRSAETAGVIITPIDESVQRWASATFDGGRHMIKARGNSSEQLLDWLGGLDEDTVQLPGFAIVSLTASTIVCHGGRTEACFEAVTVADHP